MEKRFVYFSKKENFLKATLGTEYEFTSIVFIGDSKEIWNRGILYGTPEDFDINDYLTKADAASTYQPVGNYLTEHQSLADYAKTSELNSKLEGYYTKEEVDEAIEGVDVTDQLVDYVKLQKFTEELAKKADKTEIPSLEGYATEEWVEGKNYLTEVPDDYAKKAEVTSEIEAAVKASETKIFGDGELVEAFDTIKEIGDYLKDNDHNVTEAINSAIATKADKTEIADMATKSWVNEQEFLTEHQSLSNYYNKSEVDVKVKEVDDKIPSLDGYATEQWVEDKGYLTDHQSLKEYAKSADVTKEIGEAVEGLSDTYYTKEEVDDMWEWAEY